MYAPVSLTDVAPILFPSSPETKTSPSNAFSSFARAFWAPNFPTARFPADDFLASCPGRTGSRIGLVINSSGTSSSVSKTKNASPASPIFMLKGIGLPLTYTETCGRNFVSFGNGTYIAGHQYNGTDCVKSAMRGRSNGQSTLVPKRGNAPTFLSAGSKTCHFPNLT